jgi:hypothetical protein
MQFNVSAHKVIRRTGETVPFDAAKIANAIAKAFLFDANGQARSAMPAIRSARSSAGCTLRRALRVGML